MIELKRRKYWRKELEMKYIIKRKKKTVLCTHIIHSSNIDLFVQQFVICFVNRIYKSNLRQAKNEGDTTLRVIILFDFVA